MLAGATLAGHALADKPVPAEFVNKPIALVADDWCPQHCERDKNHKGYIVDIVGQALAEEGVPYTIVYRPWIRALRLTEQGTFDGLLTPTADGYAQFQFHREAVGYQRYCFYVNADSRWTYSAPKDLLGKRVGYLKESGFGKLESFMAAHKDAIQVEEFASSQDFIRRIFKFLAAGRADTIIMTTDVHQVAVRAGERRSHLQARRLPGQREAGGRSFQGQSGTLAPDRRKARSGHTQAAPVRPPQIHPRRIRHRDVAGRQQPLVLPTASP